jgi:hypothetical protein
MRARNGKSRAHAFRSACDILTATLLPMRLRVLFAVVFAVFATWGALRAQRPFKEYPGVEYTDFKLPQDWNKTTDWIRGRLRYENSPYSRRGRRRGGPGAWTTDYPRSDRHLLEGVRRLTRIDARSVEQVLDLDGSDDVFNWPFMYAVEVGQWQIPDDQAKQMRDYIDRGGFLMVDDFHGSTEWEIFLAGITKVFPDRQIEDIPDKDPIFHVIYDLDNRFQVPGAQFLRSGRTYEQDGYNAEWKAIYDTKGRLIVAICHNMDLGDAWEWSDDPSYPEHFASLAYRIAMNYAVYDLTH